MINGQLIGEYAYDAQSRRVKKIAYGITTYFIYDQFSNLIAESDASGNITREYIYLNGKPLALIDVPLPPSVPPQTISGQRKLGTQVTCCFETLWDADGLLICNNAPD